MGLTMGLTMWKTLQKPKQWCIKDEDFTVLPIMDIVCVSGIMVINQFRGTQTAQTNPIRKKAMCKKMCIALC